MVNSDLFALSVNIVLPSGFSRVREKVFVTGTRIIVIAKTPIIRNNDGITIKCNLIAIVCKIFEQLIRIDTAP
jgi:hypothetical protein